VDVEEEYGLVSFRVYRSPDAAKALKAAADCLQGLVDGSVSRNFHKWDVSRV
jgi:Zn-dependent M16 (insulinase) family peptidase